MVLKRGDKVKNKMSGWVIHVLFLSALAWGIFHPQSVAMSAAACWVFFMAFVTAAIMAVGIFSYAVYAFCEKGIVKPGREEMPPLLCKLFGLDKPSGLRKVLWPVEAAFIITALLYSGWFVTAVIYLLSIATFRIVRGVMKGLLKDWRDGVEPCPAA